MTKKIESIFSECIFKNVFDMLFDMYYGTLWSWTNILPGVAFIFTTFDVLQRDEA